MYVLGFLGSDIGYIGALADKNLKNPDDNVLARKSDTQ